MTKKQSLILGLIFFLAPLVYGQSKGFEYYEVLKAGNSKSTNGSCIIKIENNADSYIDYYVVLTPINKYSNLFVTDKTKTNFTVKSSDSKGNFEFDYIIYAKKEKPIPSIKKNR